MSATSVSRISLACRLEPCVNFGYGRPPSPVTSLQEINALQLHTHTHTHTKRTRTQRPTWKLWNEPEFDCRLTLPRPPRPAPLYLYPIILERNRRLC